MPVAVAAIDLYMRGVGASQLHHNFRYLYPAEAHVDGYSANAISNVHVGGCSVATVLQ